MVKEAQGNSVLYKEAASNMAKTIGLSDGRLVEKYISRCIEAELCSLHEESYNISGLRTVYKFISYEQALILLLGITKLQCRYFPLHRKAGKFKNYQLLIERDLVGMNFSQQAYKINSNYPNKRNIMKEITLLQNLPVSDRNTRINRSKKARLMKKLTTSDNRIEESRVRKHADSIVTGCNHLAKLIGKSSTTAVKRFKKWGDEQSIIVHDIVYFKPTQSLQEAYMLIDSMKVSKDRGIHVYSKKEGGIKTIIGKKVIGFTSERYRYGKLHEKRTLVPNDIVVTHFPKQ